MQKIVNERCSNDNDMGIQQQQEPSNESQPDPRINLCNGDQAMKLLDFTKPTIDKQPQSGVIIDCFCKINQLIESISVFGHLNSYTPSRHHLSWLNRILCNVSKALENISSDCNQSNFDNLNFFDFIRIMSKIISIHTESYCKEAYSLIKHTESYMERLNILQISLGTIRTFVNFKTFFKNVCNIQHQLTGNTEEFTRLCQTVSDTFLTTVKMIAALEDTSQKLSLNEPVLESPEKKTCFLISVKLLRKRV